MCVRECFGGGRAQSDSAVRSYYVPHWPGCQKLGGNLAQHFPLLLRQCPWPLDSLQGPNEVWVPLAVSVWSVFTSSLRSAAETYNLVLQKGVTDCVLLGIILCFKC